MAAMCAPARRPAVLAAAQAAPSPLPPLAAAGPAFDVRPSQAREDLQRAAWLRAEAYYADKSVGRFKSSFVKQFAGQELYSLLRRTQGSQPECITLVAALPAAEGAVGSSAGGTSSSSGSGGTELGPGSCLGTLDVRLLDPVNRALSACSWPDAVPTDAAAGAEAVAAAVAVAAAAAKAEAATQAAAADGAVLAEDADATSGVLALPPPPPAVSAAVTTGPAAYVSNVVVAPAQRGCGLGRQLVAAGLAAVQQRWGCGVAYCHVETDNEAALALYRGAGFVQLGDELAPAEEGLAKRLLLCRQLGDA